jgi:hypothetical protein
MTQIIAFAGEKQSGKNTSCNFLLALKLIQSGSSKKVKIDDDGKLLVSDLYGEKPDNKLELFAFEDFVNQDLFFSQNKSCVIYSFANKLKKISCELFNIPKELAFGNDAQKNTIVPHLLWENMPGVITHKMVSSFMVGINPPIKTANDYIEYDKDFTDVFKFIIHKPGPMTVREFLQYFGTNICRSMYKNVWIDATLNQIESDAPDLALISDARFDNELLEIKKRGGIVIGLKRTIDNSKNKHASEIINFDLCDAVIDNSNMTISEQNETIYRKLIELGCNAVPKGLI